MVVVVCGGWWVVKLWCVLCGVVGADAGADVGADVGAAWMLIGACNQPDGVPDFTVFFFLLLFLLFLLLYFIVFFFCSFLVSSSSSSSPSGCHRQRYSCHGLDFARPIPLCI